MEYWKTLKSDDDAVFDQEVRFDAADIEPMITYGTNPGMGMGITQNILLRKEWERLHRFLSKNRWNIWDSSRVIVTG